MRGLLYCNQIKFWKNNIYLVHLQNEHNPISSLSLFFMFTHFLLSPTAGYFVLSSGWLAPASYSGSVGGASIPNIFIFFVRVCFESKVVKMDSFEERNIASYNGLECMCAAFLRVAPSYSLLVAVQEECPSDNIFYFLVFLFYLFSLPMRTPSPVNRLRPCSGFVSHG